MLQCHALVLRSRNPIRRWLGDKSRILEAGKSSTNPTFKLFTHHPHSHPPFHSSCTLQANNSDSSYRHCVCDRDIIKSTEIHSFVPIIVLRGQQAGVGSYLHTAVISVHDVKNINPILYILLNRASFDNTSTMRLSQTPPTLLCLLCVLLSHTKFVKALPTRNEILESLGYGYIAKRNIPCGEQGSYTCTGAQACYTNEAQVAYCSVPGETIETGGIGGYAVYTTTYTETDYLLRTSTWTSSWNAAPTTWLPTATSTWAPAVTAPVICDTSQQETSCGDLCCANWQMCAGANSCVPNPSSGLTSWAYIASTMATTTSTYSAPLKVTGSTSTSASTTVPFMPAATASGSTFPLTSSSTSHGLSGGAIAGIVIGTIAGVILLLLICFCCIVKAGFDGLLALFGLGSRRNRRSRERVEVIEERYSRHGSGGASRRDAHTGWFGAGGRPATVSESRRKKSSSGLGGFGAVGAGLLGLAVILGLKRRHDEKKVMRERRERRERSDISSNYYTDSYTGTSESSASSDRRTRDSRHPRR